MTEIQRNVAYPSEVWRPTEEFIKFLRYPRRFRREWPDLLTLIDFTDFNRFYWKRAIFPTFIDFFDFIWHSGILFNCKLSKKKSVKLKKVRKLDKSP
jgi:hypothetical protein